MTRSVDATPGHRALLTPSTRLQDVLLDVVLLTIVLAFAAQDVFHPSHSPVLLALADLALVLPLLLRRRRPVVVFWTVLGVATVLAPWDYKLTGSVALVVALYSVASRAGERATVMAIIASLLAVLGAAFAVGANVLSTFGSLAGVCVLTAFLGLWVRARRELVARLRGDAARLRAERDQQTRLAAAAERARIARELHDVVAHHLTVMVALCDGATRSWSAALSEPDPTGRREAGLDAVREAAATGRRALTDTRTLVGILADPSAPTSPQDSVPTAPQPGLADLPYLVDVVRRAGLDVVLAPGQATAPPATVPQAVQLTAYRVVQEGLTNVLKHAGRDVAARVDIVVDDDAVTVEITDRDGTATTRSARPGETGRGLSGLGDRVAAVGGRLEAGPNSAGGWRVSARLPLGAPGGVGDT